LNGGGVKAHAGQNNRDSLFRLPLQPPPPDYRGKINRAVSKLNEEINRAVSDFSVTKAQQQLTEVSEGEWLKRGERRALALFHAAAEHVPAYKDFLKGHNVSPGNIRTMDDFRRLPLIDKENYLRHYPLEQLSWYGDLSSSQMISVSSGSSGEPFFWPRGQILDAETALEHELFLVSSFDLDQRSTLFLVCFAMGMYVAGPITTTSILTLSKKGYPVTVATPGYSPDDVLKIIPKLAPAYDQIVLAGYPPSVKEIIDRGVYHGIEWARINVRFLLAGEGFNETWRTYVAKLAGNQSPIKDFLNLYGSADAAVLAYETPTSIIIRRRVAEDSAGRQKLFKQERLPSLLQYEPEHKFFEQVNGELVFTTSGGVPLVRYNIHDSGGILSREDIEKASPELKEYFAELRKESRLWNLPYVYVFGKSDQTVTLYGANIYPENIMKGLETEEIRDHVTGKFLMHTSLDAEKDQRLNIDVESAPSAKDLHQLEARISRSIHETLIANNSEYRTSYRGTGGKMIPRVKLFPNGDKRFETPAIKNKRIAPQE
jgi:phenylacetate-CoA ligase